MAAFLSVACSCGRTASVPCPSIADIPAAQEALLGWGVDERGHVKCAACLDGVEEQPAAPAIIQGDLFGQVST